LQKINSSKIVYFETGFDVWGEECRWGGVYDFQVFVKNDLGVRACCCIGS